MRKITEMFGTGTVKERLGCGNEIITVTFQVIDIKCRVGRPVCANRFKTSFQKKTVKNQTGSCRTGCISNQLE